MKIVYVIIGMLSYPATIINKLKISGTEHLAISPEECSFCSNHQTYFMDDCFPSYLLRGKMAEKISYVPYYPLNPFSAYTLYRRKIRKDF